MVNYVQITKIRTFGLEPNSDAESSSMTPCNLRWRNKMLVVNVNHSPNAVDPIALKSDWWLVNCLQKSPIRRILVASDVSEAEIFNWAVAGEKTGKEVFLRNNSDLNLSVLEKTLAWKVKRLIDFIVAALLLLLLSPVAIAIALKRKLASKPVFKKQWCVGRRGLIFKTFNWADRESNSFWSRQGLRFRLHKLPQLINVLRGEMSLVGHYPFSLDQVFALDNTQRKVLNTVPGVISTTPWRSPKLDLRAMSNKSYNYLCHWSLWSDLRIIWIATLRSLMGKSSSHKIVKL